MATPPVSKRALWISRVLSALMALFFLTDVFFKLMRPTPPPVAESFAHLGLPMTLLTPLAFTLFLCTLLYIIPSTSILGAILLTGYLGGAVCTHLRAGDPLLSHILAPTYFGILLWLALYLREPRLRALVPLRTQ